MNESVAMFLDGFVISWGGIASGVAISVVGGTAVAFMVRRWNRQDREEAAEKAGLQTQLDGFGLKLESECEARRDLERRQGGEISDTRGAIDWLCGCLGKERPTYRKRP